MQKHQFYYTSLSSSLYRFVKARNLQKHIMDKILYIISEYCPLPTVLSRFYSMQMVQSAKTVEHKHSKAVLKKVPEQVYNTDNVYTNVYCPKNLLALLSIRLFLVVSNFVSLNQLKVIMNFQKSLILLGKH